MSGSNPPRVCPREKEGKVFAKFEKPGRGIAHIRKKERVKGASNSDQERGGDWILWCNGGGQLIRLNHDDCSISEKMQEKGAGRRGRALILC